MKLPACDAYARLHRKSELTINSITAQLRYSNAVALRVICLKNISRF